MNPSSIERVSDFSIINGDRLVMLGTNGTIEILEYMGYSYNVVSTYELSTDKTAEIHNFSLINFSDCGSYLAVSSEIGE